MGRSIKKRQNLRGSSNLREDGQYWVNKYVSLISCLGGEELNSLLITSFPCRNVPLIFMLLNI